LKGDPNPLPGYTSDTQHLTQTTLISGVARGGGGMGENSPPSEKLGLNRKII